MSIHHVGECRIHPQVVDVSNMTPEKDFNPAPTEAVRGTLFASFNNPEGPPTSWLFTATGYYTGLTPSTFKMSGTTNIIAFTDRPNREADYGMSLGQVATRFERESDNPPNAVVTVTSKDGKKLSAAVTLREHALIRSQTRWTLPLKRSVMSTTRHAREDARVLGVPNEYLRRQHWATAAAFGLVEAAAAAAAAADSIGHASIVRSLHTTLESRLHVGQMDRRRMVPAGGIVCNTKPVLQRRIGASLHQ